MAMMSIARFRGTLLAHRMIVIVAMLMAMLVSVIVILSVIG
jgi:hypothetical protein